MKTLNAIQAKVSHLQREYAELTKKVDEIEDEDSEDAEVAYSRMGEIQAQLEILEWILD